MAATQSTYRAVQAVSPGKLETTTLPVVEPPAGHVAGPGRGLRAFVIRTRPRSKASCRSSGRGVPGHEAVGRIDVLEKASKAGRRPTGRHRLPRRCLRLL